MDSALFELVIGTILLLGSPGPVPIALAAVSASYGIKQGLPFYFGNLTGLIVALVAAGLGLAVLFSTFPSLELAFKIVGGLFILYVAWKLSSAPANLPTNDASSARSAPSFVDGLTLSVFNPKAYAAFMAIFSQFMLPFPSHTMSLTVTGIVCLVLVTIIDFTWLSCGRLIAPLLKKPVYGKFIRIVFSLAMVLAVGWAFTKE